MGAKHVSELRAWQLARAFKLETYRVVRNHPSSGIDQRFRTQLTHAAASAEVNVVEGFRRFVAADFARFLGYASSSIDEALSWLQDGIDREYFEADDCREAFRLGVSAGKTISALQSSLRKRSKKPVTPNASPRPDPRRDVRKDQ